MASSMPAAAASRVTFGARIRQAREARGESLRQIADKTRISVRALEALERDDLSRLPGGIFSRAFVRSYATEVGVDPEQAVREFLTQLPSELAIDSATSAADEGGVRTRFGPQAAILLGSVALAVALILIWSFAAH